MLANRCVWSTSGSNISFWYDRWIPEFHLVLHCDNENNEVKLKEYCHDNQWHFDELSPSLGPEVVHLLYEVIPKIMEDDDLRHWSPEKNGGIVRDQDDGLAYAFAHSVGSNNSLQNEIHALQTEANLISVMNVCPTNAQMYSKACATCLGGTGSFWQMHHRWKDLQ
ncbi:uncharacterized protein LOC109851239 [Asparagus officinalis]|uniref:uncharacterized protein LOC109851239 n=1 Tax=Asparagus officinalis TaxID=4686 RepID=UPI00098E0E92|nr:uncharacterized protein LOC109851239 [Asparagus officinalis]